MTRSSTTPVQDYAIAAKANGTEKNPPDSARVRDAFARVGYSLEESIADLIDNSIDARATDVLVRFIHDNRRVVRVVIADNGKGMSEETLREAMRFGSTLTHKSSDLGKYGIGLKSASLSQCDAFSVITRQNGLIAGRRWNSDSFAKEWLCETLDDDDCSLIFGAQWAGLNLRTSGTLVIWDDLTCIKSGDAKSVAETLETASYKLQIHLGLVFHRLIEKKVIRIRLDSQHIEKSTSGITQEVEALNPFGYAHSGASRYPKQFDVRVSSVGQLAILAHIWPKKSKEPGYKLGGGKVSARQGFYFYRNDRIIQAGGWNGLRGDDEPHLSLARVAIDLPPDTNGFEVSIQKNKVTVPQAFIDGVQEAASEAISFPKYLEEADSVYRSKSDNEAHDYPLVPWNGLAADTRKSLRGVLSKGERSVRKVGFEWAELDLGVVFEVDPERRRIQLNEVYRKRLLNGARRSPADAQPIKALLFLLLREVFDKKIVSKKQREELEQYNQVLLRCLK